jgi:hypothetical protein
MTLIFSTSTVYWSATIWRRKPVFWPLITLLGTIFFCHELWRAIELPILLYASCNPGPTRIEIIEFIDTIETIDIDTRGGHKTLGLIIVSSARIGGMLVLVRSKGEYSMGYSLGV